MKLPKIKSNPFHITALVAHFESNFCYGFGDPCVVSALFTLRRATVRKKYEKSEDTQLTLHMLVYFVKFVDIFQFKPSELDFNFFKGHTFNINVYFQNDLVAILFLKCYNSWIRENQNAEDNERRPYLHMTNKNCLVIRQMAVRLCMYRMAISPLQKIYLAQYLEHS